MEKIWIRVRSKHPGSATLVRLKKRKRITVAGDSERWAIFLKREL
jgi:hypothetical protein